MIRLGLGHMLCAACTLVTLGSAPARIAAAQAAGGPLRFDLGAGLTWRDTQYDPGLQSLGVGGEFAVLLPSTASAALRLSVSLSGFPGALVTQTVTLATVIDPRPGAARALSPSQNPIGDTGLSAWALEAEYRWYAEPRQTGAFVGTGGGFVHMMGGIQSEWAPLVGLSAGYVFQPSGSPVGAFLQGRVNYTWANNAPRWLCPLVIGVTVAPGR
jgi:hypothetical protein